MSRGWLIDTNVLSELRKGDRGDARVRTWLAAHAHDEHFTSVLVLGEIRRGVEAKRRRDPEGASALDVWLSGLERDFAARVLPLDVAVADLWGRLNVPDPIPAVDGLIAATAMFHDLVLVTRNVRDIERTGVPVVNPFES